MWRRGMLSEATMSYYVQAALPLHKTINNIEPNIYYLLLRYLVNLYIIILKLM